MDVIADICRDADEVRLGPGFHRMAACEHNAIRYSSGYQKLYDDGWALRIGVDITRMSSMHLVEEGVALSHDVTTTLPETLQPRYPSSHWYVQYVGRSGTY